jgi:hypothetical protein
VTLYYITKYEIRHGLRDAETGEVTRPSVPRSDPQSSPPRTTR